MALLSLTTAKTIIKNFIDGKADLYYTGRQFPTTIALDDLHYFIPYFKGKGIRDLYEITGIRTITAKEAKQSDDESDKDDIRLAFKLRFIRKLFDDYKKIDTSKMKKDTFIDTTFDGIETV